MTILSSIPGRQENPLDRGTWRAVAHQVARSQTRLKRNPQLKECQAAKNRCENSAAAWRGLEEILKSNPTV